MKFLEITNLLLVFSLIASLSYSQTSEKNKATYKESKNEFYQQTLKDLEEFNSKEEISKKSFKMDYEGIDIPKSVDEFETFWHNPPISQGVTGTCWDFSTTSFFESEIYRLHGEKIKLSELYTAYWEFVEKARRFIQKRGDSYFAEGSEGEAVKLNWQRYGTMPADAYSGLLEGQPNHDHRQVFKEMNSYLESVKSMNAWNEEENLKTIKAILNHHLGTPPESFDYNDKTYTPNEFFKEVINLNMDDYFEFLSTVKYSYYTKIEFEVPDNWWHSSNYYNIPLSKFMDIIHRSVREGYSIALGGDVSESGYCSSTDAAVVPTYDISSEFIDEYSREFRFNNKTTTDDHGIHIVGFIEKNGNDWYLIKDSGSGSRNGNAVGYYYYHEDYVKLKMLSIMVHKDMSKEVLEKFNP
ncbi:MAG: C1 family peptidase [Bacteroidota bacterium]